MKLTIRHWFKGRLNWPLVVGAGLVLFMVVLAMLGPTFAPQDPMKENFTLQVNGKVRTPPYPAFTIPGYPLGTDRWGRDLWSRILWGVRPTLIMVTVVAGFRLLVGIMIGLLVGWAEGRTARRLDSILSSLLSIPVLLVAMIGIYAIGVDRGLAAFIFGLGLTGWAETARMVSEQTRLVKRQTYVEAARALGAGDRLILFSHILRQIMSLVWVLLAFEISSTLLVTASLGFLGIYIGGGVWIEVFDFKSVNVAGLPELGQMLSTALVKISDPGGLLIIGSFLFLGILGFNLLGEGLRIELTEKEFGRRAGLMPQQFNEWFETRVLIPVRAWYEQRERLVWSSVFLLVLLLISGLYYQRNQYQFNTATVSLQVPGGQLWATQYHDPYGTLFAPVSLPVEPQLGWQIEIPGGPAGGPAVAADGTVYVGGRARVLLAFSPQGEPRWQVTLEGKPVGAPALDAQGRIYIADDRGHVSAFDPQGQLLWDVEASSTREATSGPVVGPSGMVYVTLIDAVVGISPQGVLTWRKTAADTYIDVPPALNADETLVYLKDAALAAATGQIQELPILPQAQVLFTEPAFFTGTDGGSYYRNGHTVMRWRNTEAGLQVEPMRSWEAASFVLFNPVLQGLTPDGLAWLYYSSEFTNGRIVWVDAQSRLIGNFEFPLIDARLIAIGENSEAYLCGPTGRRIQCVMVPPGTPEPVWSFDIEDGSKPVGGALIPGTLYVAAFDRFAETGTLYALSGDTP